MANNINWNTGKPIPTKGGLKVQPYLTTIGPRSSGTLFSKTGYIAFSGNPNFAYTVKDDGTVEYAEYKGGIANGTLGRQFKTLEDAVDNGFITGSALEAFRTRLSTDLTEKNTNILNGDSQPSPYFLANNPGWKPPTQGTLPPPASPNPGAAPAAPTTTPGSAAAGPNPDPDLSSFETVLGTLQDQKTKTGVSIVSGDYGKWFYPETIGKTNQDRVFIQMLKYVLPDISQSGSAFAGALSNRENDFYTKSQILGSVTLPMTNNLTESVEVDWGSDKLSSIAAGLMAGGINVVNQAATFNFDALDTAGATVGGALANGGIAGRAKQYIAAKAAAGVISGVGFQINPESYITRRTGTVPNPNLELLFNGPKLKAFGLAFKLTPRSEKEALHIRNIIKFFKKGMAPIRGNNQDNSFFLGTPHVFKIQFKPSDNGSELLSLPQFKTCALVRCEVNYTPDGLYAAYEDSKVTSQPVSVTLQLGFSELTPVYNSDYELPEKQYGSVGPDRTIFEQKAVTDLTPPPAAAAPPQGVAGNPLLTPRAGQPPVLGGTGTATRAGQQGAFSEWTEGRISGTIPMNVPFIEWKRQKGYQ